jgi:hypothetical protein
MLYPLIATVAAVGIIELLGLSKFKTWMSFGVFSVVIWASVLSLKAIQPFYFNYANDLLPKNKVISSAWGYGGYEAAQFINKQTSNPENLIVWTDYDGFCPFFKGLCIKDSEIKWVGYKTTNEISYYVVTPRGSAKLKSTWDKMRQNIDEQPVWRLEIGNRPDNFIQVYKVIRSDFTTDNWWRDKEPEPAAAIQPGRSVKINAGAKSSAKVIPKKQK